jgi:sulfate/thiosulfate transport system ATP-binding protein
MSILIENVTKRFEEFAVVNNVRLEVQTGEFFVLLGASGSGKSTLLNLIAGLIPIETGKIYLHGKDVTHLPPQKRQVGYVFQQYALFQHMTVADNIEFGPTLRKIPKAKRKQRCEELLEMVSLTGLGDRYPRQLSGGQQQRVALARALANDPELLLLDEPFGALDANIRVELRRSLRAIQRTLGITTILVTHDQDEAFDLADRIGVMHFGRLVEFGQPKDLYQQPQTELVASFLGSANLLVGNAVNGMVEIGGLKIPVPQKDDQPNRVRRVQVLFRPEDVALTANQNDLNCPCLASGEVEEVAFNGSAERLRLRTATIQGIRPIVPAVPFGTRSIYVEAHRSPDDAVRLPLAPGSKVWIGIRRTHVLPNAGLTCLVVSDGSLRSQAACGIGGQIARLAHARVTLLGCGADPALLQERMEDAKKQLGSGLAELNVRIDPSPPAKAVSQLTEHQPFDLVILGFNFSEHLEMAEQILQSGNHNLLLVPQPGAPISNALMYVSNDEMSKNSVFFPGRLLYHVGANVTLMAALSGEEMQNEFNRKRTEQLLENSSNSISLLGVQTQKKIRSGFAPEEIVRETGEGKYNLVIISSPSLSPSGEISLQGMIGQVLGELRECPVLLVQPHFEERLTPLANLR